MVHQVQYEPVLVWYPHRFDPLISSNPCVDQMSNPILPSVFPLYLRSRRVMAHVGSAAEEETKIKYMKIILLSLPIISGQPINGRRDGLAFQMIFFAAFISAR